MEPQEQPKCILYPGDPKLKTAFQGLIKLVLSQKRIKFSPETAIKAIMEQMELIDDSNLENMRATGPNFKKAKNMLRSLSGTFVMWRGFKTIEVYVFTKDKIRVQTFDDLIEVCRHDPDMSQAFACYDALDHNQKWIDDPIIIDRPAVSVEGISPRAHPISDELSEIDAEIKKKQELVIAGQARDRRSHHRGAFKGNEDPESVERAVRKDTGIPQKVKNLKQRRHRNR